jgi:AraC family transcriptional regulator of adaptative response/methylated-DNA-[protein]-cysteine methyltransferase
MMDILASQSPQPLEDYARVEQAIHYLQGNYQAQPDLAAAAASVGLSEYHFQRLFTRWVGISPKRFLQYLTKEHAKRVLLHSGDLLNAAYASGLSGPGRLHDLFVACEAVTPGDYKRAGAGLEIRYGFHSTPFGECLLAETARGLCTSIFVEPGGRSEALVGLRSRWRLARLIPDPTAGRAVVEQLLHPAVPLAAPLALYLDGTNFQVQVWEALLRIPAGAVTTYAAIAQAIGAPQSARAVGNAVGRNPLAWIIPCHRVIHADGSFGNYHYGSARKQALLGWEFVAAERTTGSGVSSVYDFD